MAPIDRTFLVRWGFVCTFLLMDWLRQLELKSFVLLKNHKGGPWKVVPEYFNLKLVRLDVSNFSHQFELNATLRTCEGTLAHIRIYEG